MFERKKQRNKEKLKNWKKEKNIQTKQNKTKKWIKKDWNIERKKQREEKRREEKKVPFYILFHFCDFVIFMQWMYKFSFLNIYKSVYITTVMYAWRRIVVPLKYWNKQTNKQPKKERKNEWMISCLFEWNCVLCNFYCKSFRRDALLIVHLDKIVR